MPEVAASDDLEDLDQPEVTPLPSRSGAGFVVWLIALTLVALCGVVTFYRAMDRGLNHDEHQFLAPAILKSRDGLVPYRDFPIFHMPNLIYAYSAMRGVSEDPIMAAKILSVMATTGVLMLLFWVALERTGNVLTRWERLWLAGGAATLFLFDPLFLYTSGKTWNHEVPAFLLALATVFHVESFSRKRVPFGVLSGVAAGLAAGTRLTYAPVCVVFVLHLAWSGGVTWRERLRAVVAWGCGCFIGLLPVLYFLVAHREAFIFDNLKFPRLSLLDPENTRVQKTITLSRKVRFLLKEVVLRSWPLAVAFIGVGTVALVQAVRGRRWGGGAVFMALLTAAVILGCFAPSRYQYQHYYALSVVGAIGLVYVAKEVCVEKRARILILGGMTVLAALSVYGLLPKEDERDRPNGWRGYWNARAARDPAMWFPRKYRAQFGILQRYVPGGERILTLAPTAALVANRQIYPEFATGVFAWRLAKFVSPELRKKLHFVAPEDLPVLLHYIPPAGILTGVEKTEEEAPLVEFAKANGYKEVDLKKGRSLWVPDETYHLHQNYIRMEDQERRRKKKPAHPPQKMDGEKAAPTEQKPEPVSEKAVGGAPPPAPEK